MPGDRSVGKRALGRLTTAARDLVRRRATSDPIDAAAVALVHPFDRPPSVTEAERRRLLGGKGAALADMTAAGMPVPPGFTLTTDACRRHLERGWDGALDAAVRDGVAALERVAGKRLGGPSDPLLVSVRSGAEVSMPGMMDTVLDVGMNATVEAALAAATGDAAFAADTRCRSLRSYAEIVAGAPTELLETLAGETSPDALQRRLADGGVVVPADPVDQVVAAVRAVFSSWSSARAASYREAEGIDDRLGTAATVQAMVFGNLGERSGTGVAFSRDPATGEQGLMGDFLPGAQGEDVVSGAHATLPLSEMAAAWPEQYAELERIADRLERSIADMVDLEFTVENGRLWMLQSRRAKRSPLAAIRAAVEMADDDSFPVDRAEAVARCARYLGDESTIVSPGAVAEPATHDAVVIASGMAASPGSATGVLCLDPDLAVELQAAGESVILVRRETSPADIHGIAAATGLFTLLGGLVSHAAVVARDWGLPAVVGATDAEIDDDGLVGPGGRVTAGSVVTVDGTTGTLAVGGAAIATADATPREAPELATIRAWAEALEKPDTSIATPTPTSPVPFPVIHALRIKGMCDAENLSTVTGAAPSEVEAALRSLADDGDAAHVETRDAWRLTESGRERHGRELGAQVDALDVGAIPYDRFLAHNAAFKAICTDWQRRDGEPNDHTDAAHDVSVLERLGALDADVRPVLAEVAAALPWAGRYADRLTGAFDRVRAGDPKAFTGVLCESYHDVWMELHEDLILTQGIDRAAEGST